ncbi:MAG: hypothetical protein U9N54_02625 [candidate division Zixibacteria bacterium]|nr:hypothetical protein [candidate division Zixibacteria bacterium]
MINKKSDDVVIVQNDKNCLTSMMEARFDTIKMISEGFYHSIYNNLSVIIGQIELMREGFLTEFENDSDRKQMQLDKIEKASELINQTLKPLFKINTLGAKGYGEEVPLNWLCDKLPLYLSGYIQYLREKKNIKLHVETEISENNNNSIQTKYIIDYIIPIILKLLNESICSGVLIVRVLNNLSKNLIEIVISENMLSSSPVINQYQQGYSDKDSNDDIFLECKTDKGLYIIKVTLPVKSISSVSTKR